MTRALSVALALAALSCKREAPPAPAPTSVLPSYDGAVVVMPHAAKCEVEISGRVIAPAGAPAPMTFVAVGDCLAEKPEILGFGGTTNGGFFIEVFAPWGADLTLCAASAPAPGRPSTLYGKAAKVMHAEAAGEVTFRDLTVELKPGPPRSFPRPF